MGAPSCAATLVCVGVRAPVYSTQRATHQMRSLGLPRSRWWSSRPGLARAVASPPVRPPSSPRGGGVVVGAWRCKFVFSVSVLCLSVLRFCVEAPRPWPAHANTAAPCGQLVRVCVSVRLPSIRQQCMCAPQRLVAARVLRSVVVGLSSRQSALVDWWLQAGLWVSRAWQHLAGVPASCHADDPRSGYHRPRACVGSVRRCNQYQHVLCNLCVLLVDQSAQAHDATHCSPAHGQPHTHTHARTHTITHTPRARFGEGVAHYGGTAVATHLAITR